MNKAKYIIFTSLILLLFISCEITFHPNSDLYYTPYGTVCMEDNYFDTRLLLYVPNEELYFLASVSKIDAQQILKSQGISEDKSKLFFLITNSNSSYRPYGTCLYAFNLENPQDHVFRFSKWIKHALYPIVKTSDKDIINVEISNDDIIYTERSGERTTIPFAAFQPKL